MPLSQYLRALRAKIGHDLVTLQSVAVLVLDGSGRLLMAQDAASGLWMTVGGAVEPDEVPADAAVREAWEETGLLVELTGVVGVFGGPAFRVRYANGDLVSYVVTAFAAFARSGDLRPDGLEASALRYVSRKELAALPMTQATREIAERAFASGAAPYFAPATWRPPAERP